MANAEIGELDFAVKDKNYKMRFGSYAIAQLETALGRPMVSIAVELDNPDKRFMKTIVTALWASLQEFHEDEVSLRDAYRILDAAGFQATGEMVAAALNLAFPEVAEGKANPPNRATRRATKATARKA
jgi:hypothetical protein